MRVKRISSDIIFHDMAVVSSPRGDGKGIQLPLGYECPSYRDEDDQIHFFTEPGFDMCPCGCLVASDAHRLLIFHRLPADIQFAPNMGGVPSEWRPSPDELIPIPGDYGPNRAAFWAGDRPKIQIHDGDDAGFWKPCYSYTVTREGLPFCMWVCRRDIDEPCDEDFMKSIST